MARHFTLITIALFILGLFSHTGAMAQGQDAKHIWKGNSINDVADKSNEDMNTIYLYNVGTKKFLNTGSYWGTVAIGFNVGMPIHIKKNGYGKYKMEGPLGTGAGSLIAFGRRKDTPGPDNDINYNHVYVDRGTEFDHSKTTNRFGSGKHPNGIIDWTFTEISSGSGGKTYCISFYNEENQGYQGIHCLRMDKREYSNVNEIKFPNGINTSDKNCQWKIVTKKDLKEAFKEKYASDEAPSDATFLIYDQNFSRSSNYINKWVVNGVDWKYYKENNERAFTPADNRYTFYVGNGAVSPNYYMANYAGYTNANVRNVGNNAKANGSVTQSVQTIKKGWYKVSCNGFYNRSGNSRMVSKFFAKVKGSTASISNVSTTLNKFKCDFEYTKDELLRIYNGDDLEQSKGGQGRVTKESPYVKAGKLFERGKYINSVLVYVPHDNDILDIGVEIEGSTNERDWTCWDNVQLLYCGNNDIVLDERESSINYIKEQVDPINAGTLILKRTMKINTWNSIMLPVNLTVGQVKTAFGEDVKLSRQPKQHSTVKSRISFESVKLDVDDEEIAIEANKLYLIKPQKEPTGIEREDPYTKQLKSGRWLSIPAPYYVINNVSLTADPSKLSKYKDGVIKEDATTSTTPDEKLQFCGSVINQTNKVVPANSYALGSNDGKWYFTQNPLSIKGFRCWIATGSQAYAKTIRFFIDGVEEDMVTGIDNVVVENNNNEVMGTVYNLNGQVVRAGATSLEGLPKGIYIVNNKKYIVK
ncbi:adhesin [Prevotella melaninogenica]|uniref:Adhesin n=1 Tax=Prevotella melaninogenica TaxID=28132 RepID=A0ABX7XNW5_9BACT|nr:adhesin [Prevotella melaninogenica]QUB75273.1 adhesin [Prevotella melaninogenica]